MPLSNRQITSQSRRTQPSTLSPVSSDFSPRMRVAEGMLPTGLPAVTSLGLAPSPARSKQHVLGIRETVKAELACDSKPFTRGSLPEGSSRSSQDVSTVSENITIEVMQAIGSMTIPSREFTGSRHEPVLILDSEDETSVDSQSRRTNDHTKRAQRLAYERSTAIPPAFAAPAVSVEDEKKPVRLASSSQPPRQDYGRPVSNDANPTLLANGEDFTRTMSLPDTQPPTSVVEPLAQSTLPSSSSASRPAAEGSRPDHPAIKSEIRITPPPPYEPVLLTSPAALQLVKQEESSAPVDVAIHPMPRNPTPKPLLYAPRSEVCSLYVLSEALLT
jgi:hypothetical protein